MELHRWDRAAHYLKLKFSEGEVDLIVSAPISSLVPIVRQISNGDTGRMENRSFELTPPAEIALKKLHYRATMLKPRDVFDIAVVDAIDREGLTTHLHEVAEKKDDLVRRLGDINEDFL